MQVILGVGLAVGLLAVIGLAPLAYIYFVQKRDPPLWLMLGLAATAAMAWTVLAQIMGLLVF